MWLRGPLACAGAAGGARARQVARAHRRASGRHAQRSPRSHTRGASASKRSTDATGETSATAVTRKCSPSYRRVAQSRNSRALTVPVGLVLDWIAPGSDSIPRRVPVEPMHWRPRYDTERAVASPLVQPTNNPSSTARLPAAYRIPQGTTTTTRYLPPDQPARPEHDCRTMSGIICPVRSGTSSNFQLPLSVQPQLTAEVSTRPAAEVSSWPAVHGGMKANSSEIQSRPVCASC